MSNVNEVKDLHSDVQRYLENDCYCRYEVYEPNGFYYQIIKPENKCKMLAENEKLVACITQQDSDGSMPQVVIFWKGDNDNIVDAVRIDATENNIAFVKKLASDSLVKDVDKIDAFDPEGDAKALAQVFEIADAIVVD